VYVVSGYLIARDVKSGEVMTLQGSTLTAADLVVTNGIVHGIDAVILPKNWQLLAGAA